MLMPSSSELVRAISEQILSTSSFETLNLNSIRLLGYMILGVEAGGLRSSGFCSKNKDLMKQSKTNHLYINFAVYVLVKTVCGVTVGLSKQI